MVNSMVSIQLLNIMKSPNSLVTQHSYAIKANITQTKRKKYKRKHVIAHDKQHQPLTYEHLHGHIKINSRYDSRERRAYHLKKREKSVVSAS